MNAHGDIRHASRPVPCRPRMSRQNRAKLFAPYNALKEFQPAVRAKEVLYVRRRELSEVQQERLDRQLRELKRKDTVSVTCFQPKKDGLDPDRGPYISRSGTLENIDAVFQVLVLDRQPIAFSDILEIRRV